MAKLINSTKECSYNKVISNKHFCEHPKHKIRYCTWVKDFPKDCPLQNGIPIEILLKTLSKINIITTDRTMFAIMKDGQL